MKLYTLLESLGICPEDHGQIEIAGIQNDSRKIKDGFLFVAISGYESDGHDYIAQALENGAAAVVGEAELDLPVPYFRVQDSRTALGRLASTFYGFPSRNKKVVGITGTNGKTTVAFMIKHILESAGKSVSLFGTVAYMINNKVFKPENTTPDALILQSLLAESHDEYAVLEVSSHALVQGRAKGLELDFGLFTNLSHDHLDYHETMDEYFEAKTLMFDCLKENGQAVISVLDEWGGKLDSKLKKQGMATATLGWSKSEKMMIKDIVLNGHTRFTVMAEGKSYEVNLPCPGEHNVYNAALAFLSALQMGIAPVDIIRSLASFPGVPGRFEKMHHPTGATFIIDYAHTTDAIEYCLEAAIAQGAKRITHIYGFRGGRDTSKRGHMVSASARLCDRFILTFDDLNGITEKDMIAELSLLNAEYGNDKGMVIPDRTEAIQFAWNDAREGDWVIITGKGPEEYKTSFRLPVSSDKETIAYLGQDSKHTQIV